jgi:hypothetical protein
LPYSLEIVPSAQAEMRSLVGLSREGRNKLFANLDFLRYVSDQFRGDPVNRASGNLVFTTIFRDRGAVRAFLYRVDDSPAVSSALRILAVDDVSPAP